MLVIGSLFSAVVNFAENRLARLAKFSSFPPLLDVDCPLDLIDADATIRTMTSEFMTCTYEIFKHSDDLMTTFIPSLQAETKQFQSATPAQNHDQARDDARLRDLNEACLTPSSRSPSSPCPSLSPASETSSLSSPPSPLSSPLLDYTSLPGEQPDIESSDDDTGKLSPLNLKLTAGPRHKGSGLGLKKIASLPSLSSLRLRSTTSSFASLASPGSSASLSTYSTPSPRKRSPRHSRSPSYSDSDPFARHGDSYLSTGLPAKNRDGDRSDAGLWDITVYDSYATPFRPATEDLVRDSPLPHRGIRDPDSAHAPYGSIDSTSAAHHRQPFPLAADPSPSTPDSLFAPATPSTSSEYGVDIERSKPALRPLILPERVARRQLATLTPRPQLRQLVLPKYVNKRGGTRIVIPPSRSSSLATLPEPTTPTPFIRYHRAMTSLHPDMQQGDQAVQASDSEAIRPRRCKDKPLQEIISLLDVSGITKVDKAVQTSPELSDADNVIEGKRKGTLELPQLVMPQRRMEGWNDATRSEGVSEVPSEGEMQQLSQEIDQVLSVIKQQAAVKKVDGKGDDGMHESSELAYIQ
ncbi:hypothetical protein CERSUDRAFT_100493 [Gelatoporia subvermispora B]|uniref:Uncharacterized protein n=1 Tax=Ceriporiopsis subvermispora (strain B) TaxID=914234 RepID=M2P7J1_CERS8|nr:hypothetical protein CERSUDRAFT_100493 [Gelatoporia subvermispora B]